VIPKPKPIKRDKFTCVRCGETKTRDAFYRRAAKKNGLCSYCKVCTYRQSSEWAKQNPGRVRSTRIAHRAANHKYILAKERLYYQENKERLDAYKRKHSKNNPHLLFAQRIRRKYGIGVDDYNSAALIQDGKCALCRRGDARLVIDHDHKTGRFRGLLCVRCNAAMGTFGDSVEGLQKAMLYLENGYSNENNPS